MRHLLLSGGAVVLLSSIALAAVMDAVTIKRVATVGQKNAFKLAGTMTMSFDGQEHTLAADSADVVKAVDATTGNITIESTESNVLFDGNAPPGGGDTAGQTVKVVYKPSGEIASIDGGTAGGGSPVRMQDLSSFYYPTKPVNVGDSWSVDLKPSVDGAVPIHADFKLVGTEQIGSVMAQKVDETAKETVADGGSIHNVFWLDPATGDPVKETSELTNVNLGPFTITTGKMTMTKVQS